MSCRLYILTTSLFLLMTAGLSGQQWLSAEKYGNGSDGNLQITSDQTESVVDASCYGNAGTKLLYASNAGFAANQIILIHQSRGSGFGNWELNVIDGYTSGQITTKYNLAYTFYDNGGSNQAQVRVVRQYANVTVDAGRIWYGKAWDGNVGGIMAFMCSGTLTVNGGIYHAGRGYRGGYPWGNNQNPGVQGESQYGTGGYTTGANWIGGGGGKANAGSNSGAAGGGGGHRTGGTTGSGKGSYTGGAGGGTISASNDLSSMIFGGGGGAAGLDGGSQNMSAGGAGGGIVAIFAKTVTVSAAGWISAEGASSAYAQYGTGGGGAGGCILLKADTANVRLNAIGGYGGGSQENYGVGGTGGGGAVALYYGTSVAGTSNPAYAAFQNDQYKGHDAPTAFSLVSPLAGGTLGDTTPAFTWEVSTDPESQPVTYTLLIDTDSGFAAPIARTYAGLTTHSYTLDAGESLTNGTYYWKVIATDGSRTRTSNDIRTLTIDAALPASPTMTSIQADLDSGAITRIFGAAPNGTSVGLFRWDGDLAQYVSVPGSATWNGPWFEFAPTQELDSGSMVYIQVQEPGGSSVTEVRTITVEAATNIFPDIMVSHGTQPGQSLRLEKDTSYTFRIPVNAGAAVTVRAWLRTNTAYTGSAPRITLTGLGIDGTGPATADMTAGSNTWQELSVTGTPAVQGVLHLRVETFSTADTAAAWIDDLSVSQ